eukprot:1159566-Pelagomonas_calceolata.AAC.5
MSNKERTEANCDANTCACMPGVVAWNPAFWCALSLMRGNPVWHSDGLLALLYLTHLLPPGSPPERPVAMELRSIKCLLVICWAHMLHFNVVAAERALNTNIDLIALSATGLSTMFSSEPLSEVLGSAYYVAPEVLRECYSKEADVWSLGVVLFIALGGYAPFDGKNEREVSGCGIQNSCPCPLAAFHLWMANPGPRVGFCARPLGIAHAVYDVLLLLDDGCLMK